MEKELVQSDLHSKRKVPNTIRKYHFRGSDAHHPHEPRIPNSRNIQRIFRNRKYGQPYTIRITPEGWPLLPTTCCFLLLGFTGHPSPIKCISLCIPSPYDCPLPGTMVAKHVSKERWERMKNMKTKTAVCTLRSAIYDWEYNKGFDVIIQEYHGISATDTEVNKIKGHVEFDTHVHMSKYPLEGGTGSSGESQHLTLQKLPHWQTFLGINTFCDFEFLEWGALT